MDSLKGLINKVKMPKAIITVPTEDKLKLKTIEKSLKEETTEKSQMYVHIGIKIYDLAKKEHIEVEQIKVSLNKIDSLNSEIAELEKLERTWIEYSKLNTIKIKNNFDPKIKKQLEEKIKEREQLYSFIGMEVYDLSIEQKIEIEQIKPYLDIMETLNNDIKELEQQKEILEKMAIEKKNSGKNVCSCGYKLKSQDRFCPNCGQVIMRDIITCTCGAELSKNVKFCNVCGKSIEDIFQMQEIPKMNVSEMRECICGAKVPAGQFMCLECGRKIED